MTMTTPQLTGTVLVCWCPQPGAVTPPEGFVWVPCHDCQRTLQTEPEYLTALARTPGPTRVCCIPCTITRLRLLRPEVDHLAMVGPLRVIARVRDLTADGGLA